MGKVTFLPINKQWTFKFSITFWTRLWSLKSWKLHLRSYKILSDLIRLRQDLKSIFRLKLQNVITGFAWELQESMKALMNQESPQKFEVVQRNHLKDQIRYRPQRLVPLVELGRRSDKGELAFHRGLIYIGGNGARRAHWKI